jgi:hypothetical protein
MELLNLIDAPKDGRTEKLIKLSKSVTDVICRTAGRGYDLVNMFLPLKEFSEKPKRARIPISWGSALTLNPKLAKDLTILNGNLPIYKALLLTLGERPSIEDLHATLLTSGENAIMIYLLLELEITCLHHVSLEELVKVSGRFSKFLKIPVRGTPRFDLKEMICFFHKDPRLNHHDFFDIDTDDVIRAGPIRQREIYININTYFDERLIPYTEEERLEIFSAYFSRGNMFFEDEIEEPQEIPKIDEIYLCKLLYIHKLFNSKFSRPMVLMIKRFILHMWSFHRAQTKNDISILSLIAAAGPRLTFGGPEIDGVSDKPLEIIVQNSNVLGSTFPVFEQMDRSFGSHEIYTGANGSYRLFKILLRNPISPLIPLIFFGRINNLVHQSVHLGLGIYNTVGRRIPVSVWDFESVPEEDKSLICSFIKNYRYDNSIMREVLRDVVSERGRPTPLLVDALMKGQFDKESFTKEEIGLDVDAMFRSNLEPLLTVFGSRSLKLTETEYKEIRTNARLNRKWKTFQKRFDLVWITRLAVLRIST